MLFVCVIFAGVGRGVILMSFAKLRGGNSGNFFEGSVKGLLTCKATFIAYFIYGLIGGEQELFCLVYPQK